MGKTSAAQNRAVEKWEQKNKDKKRHIVAKSQAKRFVAQFATVEELDWLEDLIKEKRAQNGDI